MAAFVTVVSIVEIVTLLVATGTGMAASIMIGITRTQMGGLCILKAKVTQDGSDPSQFHVASSAPSRCQFCLVIHVLGVLMSFGFALYRLQVVCRGKFDIYIMGRMIVSVVFGLFTFLLFVDACIVSVGLRAFCGGLLNLEGIPETTTCRDFQKVERWYLLDSDRDINGSHFFDNMTTAVIASWIAFLLWLALTCMSVAACWIMRRRTNLRMPKSSKGVAAQSVQAST